MLVSDRVGALERDISAINRSDGIFIGFAQALALVPGVSRSGATISAAACCRGLDRESAARYSFLLSIPAVVLSGLFELRKIGERGRRRRRADRHRDGAGLHRRLRLDRLPAPVSDPPRLGVFVVYRVVLGTVVVVLAVNGTIS